MNIIFISPYLNISEIAKQFNKIDVDVCAYTKICEIKIPHNIKKSLWFYFCPTLDVESIDEDLQQIQTAFDNINLIACIPHFVDVNFLQVYNLKNVITPASWGINDIFDRVYSEFLLFEKQKTVDKIYGATIAMKEVYRKITKYANIENTILITGETGTGKELVAEAIYKISERNKFPYLPVNCSEFSPNIVSSELFGHKKGAFTGAISDRNGLFVEVGKGVIFLDEIGELSLDIQAQLLRVVEYRQVRPVGSNSYVPFEGKIIFATNRNLKKEYSQGNFRQDLYERLKTFNINIPPLRLRKADIPLLSQHFLQEYNTKYDKKHTISNSSMDRLFFYNWPGNVRELKGVIEYAAVNTDHENSPLDKFYLYEKLIDQESSLENSNCIVVPFDPYVKKWNETQGYFKKQYFSKLLEMTDGDKTKAAALAGITRQQLHNIIKDV